MPQWNETSYFEHAKGLSTKVQSALRKLHDLREVDGIRLEFGSGKTPRFKIYLDKAGGASVLMPAADDGTLFVPFQLHQGNSALVEPLGAFVRDRMGFVLPSDWRSRKPYVPAELWVPHADVLARLLKSLAENR